MRKITLIAVLFLSALAAFAAERKDALRHSLGTYSNPPRTANGRVDCAELVKQLVDLHANCYSWTIYVAATDWDDLKIFLPLARAKNIRVWVSLLPPSEAAPVSDLHCEPFRLDYERWAIEFARLSLRETNLLGWSIDDFPYNLKFFTPEKMRTILRGARDINPKLAFVPCVYFRDLKPMFIKQYIPMFDGILFPYRDESHRENLKDPSHVEEEVNSIRQRVGADYPIIVDIYFTAHSRLGGTTLQYDEIATIAAHKCADGVQVYTHQHPVKNAEKYRLIQRLFTDWTKK